jgi:hypothetical protein
MRIGLGAAREAPGLELLDATERDLDEEALKRLARRWAPGHGAGEMSRSYSFPYALVGWHSDRRRAALRPTPA